MSSRSVIYPEHRVDVSQRDSLAGVSQKMMKMDEALGYHSPVTADYTTHRRTDSDPQHVIPPSRDGWLSASTRLSQNCARFLLLLAAAWIAIVY